jgi:hypothetical protein
MKRIAIFNIGFALLSAACVSTQTSVDRVAVGQCFNDPDGDHEFEGEVAKVDTVDCTEPHDNEFFHIYSMTESSFPGVTIAHELAHQKCIVRFDSYVGRDYWSSSLDVGTIVPMRESWESGDRKVKCFLYDLEFDLLTRSAKSSGL